MSGENVAGIPSAGCGGEKHKYVFFTLASLASNNAAIELMPEKIAAITGLRGMFRQTGGVIGTSLIVLVLSRFSDKTAGFQAVFLAMIALYASG